MVAVGNPCTWTIYGLILTTLCSTKFFLYKRFENIALNEDVVITSQGFQDSPTENLKIPSQGFHDSPIENPEIASQGLQDSPIEDLVDGTAEKLVESDKKDDLRDENAGSEDSLPTESQVPGHAPYNSDETNLLPQEKDLIEAKEAPTLAVVSADPIPVETDLVEAEIEAAETQMMEPETDNYFSNKVLTKLAKLMSKVDALPIATLPDDLMDAHAHAYEKLAETWRVYKRVAATLKEHDDGSGIVSDSTKFHVQMLAIVMGSGLVFYFALRIACKIVRAIFARILGTICRCIFGSRAKEQARLRAAFEQKCIEANAAEIKAKNDRRERLLAMEDKIQFLIDRHPENPKNMVKMRRSISTASI